MNIKVKKQVKHGKQREIAKLLCKNGLNQGEKIRKESERERRQLLKNLAKIMRER